MRRSEPVVFKSGLHHLDLLLLLLLLLVRVFLDVMLDAVQGMGFETEEKTEEQQNQLTHQIDLLVLIDFATWRKLSLPENAARARSTVAKASYPTRPRPGKTSGALLLLVP